MYYVTRKLLNGSKQNIKYPMINKKERVVLFHRFNGVVSPDEKQSQSMPYRCVSL